jgi:IMP dehydrogenase/GMP reductase
MNDIRKVLSYNDVLLTPRNSELEHLKDADLIYDYNGWASYPIINSPMDTVCSTDLISFLDNFGCLTTIHRWFSSVDEQIKFYERCFLSLSGNKCFIAVGTVSKWKPWIDKLISYQKEKGELFNFLLDVSNGDSKCAIDTVQYIRHNTPKGCRIMAGNVATRSGFARLQDAGANFIRVGLGGSSICSTRQATGFGVPTLTSIFDCAKVKDGAYLVADGGTEYSGDLCKAIGAGADMVMLGKMLAATSLSGGEKITDADGNIKYVRYSGMASKEAIEKLNSQKSVVSIEGISGLIPYSGETKEVMNNLVGNLQSAVAYYCGAKNWEEFRRKVKFQEISQQGWEESKTRVL